MVKTTSIKTEIIQELDRLSLEQLHRVLDFTRTVQQPLGTPGEDLTARMDSFKFEPGNLDEIAQAIEEGCERIDWDEW
ncbi:MAG TPA: hypothetical protein VHP83_07170 [Aggregatilineaceae bacterium]|nr:hypothetical protein [Aggregatilineaceae bacterium]